MYEYIHTFVDLFGCEWDANLNVNIVHVGLALRTSNIIIARPAAGTGKANPAKAKHQKVAAKPKHIYYIPRITYKITQMHSDCMVWDRLIAQMFECVRPPRLWPDHLIYHGQNDQDPVVWLSLAKLLLI